MKNKDRLKSWFNSPLGQKIVFVSLLILGFFIILFGFTLLKANIKQPFLSHSGWEEDQVEEEQKILSKLRTTDTDKDGLSDFDELYVYNTSIYLEDTDSDGYSDKEEIDSQHDPLCPIGEDCGYLGSADSSQIEKTENLNQLQSFQGTQGLVGTEGEMSIKELRQLLEESGISKELLDEIDDQTLLKTYQETLEETSSASQPSSPQAGLPAQTGLPAQAGGEEYLLDEFQNMSADQIRQFLISSGVEKETLEAIDDETLKSIFLEAME